MGSVPQFSYTWAKKPEMHTSVAAGWPTHLDILDANP